MNYTILSQAGWKAGAHTQAEAEAKGLKHFQEWVAVGRIIPVSIYYRDGSLVKRFD